MLDLVRKLKAMKVNNYFIVVLILNWLCMRLNYSSENRYIRNNEDQRNPYNIQDTYIYSVSRNITIYTITDWADKYLHKNGNIGINSYNHYFTQRTL